MQQLSNESQLIAKVILTGDQLAFTKLVQHYQQAVRQYCRRLCAPDHALADDIAQETFLQAYRKIALYQGRGKFQAWLFRIAYFQFLQYLRSKKIADQLPTDLESPDSHTDAMETRDLEKAMEQLPANERACLTLHYSFGYTHAEITTILAMPLGTVKSHSRRGKERLSQLLNVSSSTSADQSVA